MKTYACLFPTWRYVALVQNASCSKLATALFCSGSKYSGVQSIVCKNICDHSKGEVLYECNARLVLLKIHSLILEMYFGRVF